MTPLHPSTENSIRIIANYIVASLKIYLIETKVRIFFQILNTDGSTATSLLLIHPGNWKFSGKMTGWKFWDVELLSKKSWKNVEQVIK